MQLSRTFFGRYRSAQKIRRSLPTPAVTLSEMFGMLHPFYPESALGVWKIPDHAVLWQQ